MESLHLLATYVPSTSVRCTLRLVLITCGLVVGSGTHASDQFSTYTQYPLLNSQHSCVHAVYHIGHQGNVELRLHRSWQFHMQKRHRCKTVHIIYCIVWTDVVWPRVLLPYSEICWLWKVKGHKMEGDQEPVHSVFFQSLDLAWTHDLQVGFQ